MKALDSILLVDDDAIANYLHERLIKKTQLAREVITKANGREAIEYIKERYKTMRTLPSLIILDLSMPVMNGIDFLKEICQSDLLFANHIPIAILTSSDHPDDIKRVKEIKNCFYLLKPLSMAKLTDTIEKCFSQTAC